MLFDFNEAWSRVGATQYDACVCGAGPAGITIARKLATRGKKVLLLEGGGLTYDDKSQDHYKGRNIGRTIWLETMRLRYIGGTSNHWAGLCALQDPAAFDGRQDNGLPGWPISREQVLSNLNEAKEIVDIAGKDLATPARQPGFESPWFGRYVHVHSSPTRFFEKYGAEIRQSQQIDAFYHANLIDLRLSDNLAQVGNLRISNYNGQISEISSAQYVLALGGIENARILLNANRQIPSGIGNHSGMVGRCFMDDLNAAIGRFLVTDTEFWQQRSFPDGQILLAPTVALMGQRNIGNGVLEYMSDLPAWVILQKHGRLRVLKEFIQETGCSWSALKELARKFVDFDCPGDGIIRSIIEQEPNPDSRVTLTDNVDSLGLRRVQMNWQLTQTDLNTIRVLSIESAKEMARLNLARVQLAPFILNADLDIPVYGHGHHMGTTRMSADPRHGVVDENCRVHGIENLYLAGSSVFPKGGGKNPTLTIVLLALRLGEFLNKH